MVTVSSRTALINTCRIPLSWQSDEIGSDEELDEEEETGNLAKDAERPIEEIMKAYYAKKTGGDDEEEEEEEEEFSDEDDESASESESDKKPAPPAKKAAAPAPKKK